MHYTYEKHMHVTHRSTRAKDNLHANAKWCACNILQASPVDSDNDKYYRTHRQIGALRASHAVDGIHA